VGIKASKEQIAKWEAAGLIPKSSSVRTPAEILDTLDEKDWQSLIVARAKELGWELIYHTYDSRKSVKGFPDLFLVHEQWGKAVVFECKVRPNVATPEQIRWINGMYAAGIPAYIVYPADEPKVMAILRGE